MQIVARVPGWSGRQFTPDTQPTSYTMPLQFILSWGPRRCRGQVDSEVDEQPSRSLAQAADGVVVAAMGVAHEVASVFDGAEFDQCRMHRL